MQTVGWRGNKPIIQFTQITMGIGCRDPASFSNREPVVSNQFGTEGPDFRKDNREWWEKDAPRPVAGQLCIIHPKG